MQFDIIAVLPGLVEGALAEGVLRRARQEGVIQVRVHALREYAEGPHRRVDDSPYGGGAGMVLKPEPIFAAIEDVTKRFPAEPSRTILLSPQGALLTHALAVRLSLCERLILICGRYEGVDERVRELLVDEELSIGDYVLTGGEPAAVVVLDAVARLVPGVVGNSSSVLQDSFADAGLGVPQYTRPPRFRGAEVPEVLRSGNHARIEAWRRERIRRNTGRRRPDLLDAADRVGGAPAAENDGEAGED
jgi:tRNA (guanine37-N1)-methyltransferase